MPKTKIDVTVTPGMLIVFRFDGGLHVGRVKEIVNETSIRLHEGIRLHRENILAVGLYPDQANIEFDTSQ